MSAQTLRPVPWWGLAAAGFVLLAVGLELVASAWANSPVPPWAASLAPLAWPRYGWHGGCWWRGPQALSTSLWPAAPSGRDPCSLR